MNMVSINRECETGCGNAVLDILTTIQNGRQHIMTPSNHQPTIFPVLIDESGRAFVVGRSENEV